MPRHYASSTPYSDRPEASQCWPAQPIGYWVLLQHLHRSPSVACQSTSVQLRVKMLSTAFAAALWEPDRLTGTRLRVKPTGARACGSRPRPPPPTRRALEQ